jgi:aryl-alcohol dehydrogenase-like predicted oxidoreductase
MGESVKLVRYAFDCGINVFDTAEDYTSGVSEDIIGQGLKDKKKLILADCVKPEYQEFVDVVMFCYNHLEGKSLLRQI